MLQKYYLLLPLLGCFAGCTAAGNSDADGADDDVEPLFSSVVAGEWSLKSDATSTQGACTQEFAGGPGSNLEMLLQSRSEAMGGPYPTYPASVTMQNDEGTVTTLDLACAQGENSALDPWYVNSVVCMGELAEAYRPDPNVDASWPIEVRIEGLFNQVAPCDMDPPEALLDFTGMDASWTLSLQDTCVGADCDANSVPLGEDGAPLCIQKLQVLSEWKGCADADSACRPFADYSNIPSCPGG